MDLEEQGAWQAARRGATSIARSGCGIPAGAAQGIKDSGFGRGGGLPEIWNDLQIKNVGVRR